MLWPLVTQLLFERLFVREIFCNDVILAAESGEADLNTCACRLVGLDEDEPVFMRDDHPETRVLFIDSGESIYCCRIESKRIAEEGDLPGEQFRYLVPVLVAQDLAVMPPVSAEVALGPGQG